MGFSRFSVQVSFFFRLEEHQGKEISEWHSKELENDLSSYSVRVDSEPFIN